MIEIDGSFWAISLKAQSATPAKRKRIAAEKNGGVVATMSRMARNDPPQKK